MITTAIFTHVIVFGLAAAVTIPAIDFILVAMRESRFSDPDRVDGYLPSPVRRHPVTRTKHDLMGGMADSRSLERSTTFNVFVSRSETGPALHVRRSAIMPFYVTSNGLTLTPNLKPAVRARSMKRLSHPHAEYWQYGNGAAYEHV